MDIIDKIIFLDFDGVLNSEKMYEINDNISFDSLYSVDINLVKKITDICESSNHIGIVITSSWRTESIENTVDFFRKECPNLNPIIQYIIGTTPRMYNQIRGNEIEWWLKHVITKNMTLNSEVRKHFKENVNISDKPEYVIIDNDSDMLETQMEHFI